MTIGVENSGTISEAVLMARPFRCPAQPSSPPRRACEGAEAGERKGPVAMQREGEVVLQTNQTLRQQTPQPTSSSPRKRGSPPSPPAMTRAERALDTAER